MLPSETLALAYGIVVGKAITNDGVPDIRILTAVGNGVKLSYLQGPT